MFRLLFNPRPCASVATIISFSIPYCWVTYINLFQRQNQLYFLHILGCFDILLFDWVNLQGCLLHLRHLLKTVFEHQTQCQIPKMSVHVCDCEPKIAQQYVRMLSLMRSTPALVELFALSVTNLLQTLETSEP